MSRTIADLIHDFLAPEQPEDCRQASLGLLVDALGKSGPVLHSGHIVTATECEVTFDRTRHLGEFPADDIPPDDYLADLWQVPESKTAQIPSV